MQDRKFADTTLPDAEHTVLAAEAAHSDGTVIPEADTDGESRGAGGNAQRMHSSSSAGGKQADSSWEGGAGGKGGGYVTWPASRGDDTARTSPDLRGTRSRTFSLPSLSGPNFSPVFLRVAIAVWPATTWTAET